MIVVKLEVFQVTRKQKFGIYRRLHPFSTIYQEEVNTKFSPFGHQTLISHWCYKVSKAWCHRCEANPNSTNSEGTKWISACESPQLCHSNTVVGLNVTFEFHTCSWPACNLRRFKNHQSSKLFTYFSLSSDSNKA